MYHIQSYYCQSDLRKIERYASDSIRVLENKVINEEDIESERNWLLRLRERLEMEHPRCGHVDVVVQKQEVLNMNRLDICFGKLCYYGKKCEFLDREDIAE